MERYIGLFKPEHAEREDIGELIIDGNCIEFYFRGNASSFKQWFVGKDDKHFFRILVERYDEIGSNCTLSSSISFKVHSVFFRNSEFVKNWRPNEIIECSFVIPELIMWLGQSTVETVISDEGTFIAGEKIIDPIILKELNPHIEIRFESEGLRKVGVSLTEISLVNNPRITIIYSDVVNVDVVTKDITYIMEFFGLLINHVSDAKDIRLRFHEQVLPTWLCLNFDYSYNLRHTQIEYNSLTHLKEMKDRIKALFSTWYDFCKNEKYDLIRIMYFICNKRKDVFAEDTFIYYVRFIEGYYLRQNNTEEESNKIRDIIDRFSDKIKEIIFCEENKDVFSEIINQAIPDWKFNSKHAKEVSNWIARGYLNRSDLKNSLATYDSSYFNIITRNACHVVLFKKSSEEEIIKTYFDSIVKTRNYYSHFKSDNTGVLSFAQLLKTINVLKAIIVMIFFESMGMDKKEIQQYIIRDPELMEQTYGMRLDFNQRMEG